MMTSGSSIPKILMLHGYTQNAFIFQKRLSAIRKACKDRCEMVFIDAPHILKIPTDSPGAFAKFDSAAIPNSDGETDPNLVPRFWWQMKEGETGLKKYVGFDESMKLLRRVIDEQGPFQACFGFSQGAALAALLSSVIENPTLHPSFSDPPLKVQDRFRSVIIVSGFKLLDFPEDWYLHRNPKNRSSEDDGRLRTRSLHVLGRSDLIVGKDRSLPLIESFNGPRVEYHDGGHFVPSTKNWRNFFSEYLQSFDEGSPIKSPTHDNSNNVNDSSVSNPEVDKSFFKDGSGRGEEIDGEPKL